MLVSDVTGDLGYMIKRTRFVFLYMFSLVYSTVEPLFLATTMQGPIHGHLFVGRHGSLRSSLLLPQTKLQMRGNRTPTQTLSMCMRARMGMMWM